MPEHLELIGREVALRKDFPRLGLPKGGYVIEEVLFRKPSILYGVRPKDAPVQVYLRNGLVFLDEFWFDSVD